MKNYVEPFPLCDKILLKLAQTQYRRMAYADIQQSFAGNTDISSALGQLVHDQYVRKEAGSNGLYTLIASGSQFISDGGYQEEFQRQNLAEKIKRQINEANLEMSKAIIEVSKATTKNAKTNSVVMYISRAGIAHI